jgi:hypothetical protein
MIAATIVYFALSWWMKISSVREMTALLVTRTKPS